MVQYVTVGHLTLDDIVLLGTERIMPRQMGGGALYSAGGARIWHEEVGIHSCAGKDWPSAYFADLTASGIDTAGVCRSECLNTLGLWLLHEAPDRKQQLPRLDSGAVSDLEAQRGGLPAVYGKARGYHLSTSLPETQLASKEAIRAQNPDAIITLDIWVESFFDSGLYREKRFLHGIDAFLPSDKEVEQLWGGEELHSLLRHFASAGPRCVAVKRGRSGALLYDARTETFWEVPIFPSETVDSTGAGDAFCGGFLVGLSQTDEPVEAAVYGTVSASFAVEGFGVSSLFGVDSAERDRRFAYVRNRVRRL